MRDESGTMRWKTQRVACAACAGDCTKYTLLLLSRLTIPPVSVSQILALVARSSLRVLIVCRRLASREVCSPQYAGERPVRCWDCRTQVVLFGEASRSV